MYCIVQSIFDTFSCCSAWSIIWSLAHVHNALFFTNVASRPESMSFEQHTCAIVRYEHSTPFSPTNAWKWQLLCFHYFPLRSYFILAHTCNAQTPWWNLTLNGSKYVDTYSSVFCMFEVLQTINRRWYPAKTLPQNPQMLKSKSNE